MPEQRFDYNPDCRLSLCRWGSPLFLRWTCGLVPMNASRGSSRYPSWRWDGRHGFLKMLREQVHGRPKNDMLRARCASWKYLLAGSRNVQETDLLEISRVVVLA